MNGLIRLNPLLTGFIRFEQNNPGSMFFFNSCGFYKSWKCVSPKKLIFQFSKISKICAKISIFARSKKVEFLFSKIFLKVFIFENFSQISNSFSKFKFRFPKFHIMESVIKCHWIWCSFCFLFGYWCFHWNSFLNH